MVYNSGHQKTRFGYIPYPQKCVKTSYYNKPTKKLKYYLGYKKPCSNTYVYNNYYPPKKDYCVKSYEVTEECKKEKYDQKYTTCDYLDYKPKQCEKKNAIYPSFPTPPAPPNYSKNNYCAPNYSAPKNDYCPPQSNYSAPNYSKPPASSYYTPPKSDYCPPKSNYSQPSYSPPASSYYTPPNYTPSYAPPNYTPSYAPPNYTPSYAPPNYTPSYAPSSNYDASYCEYVSQLSAGGCPITYDCSNNAYPVYPSHYYNTGYLKYTSQVSGYPTHNYY